MSRDPNLDLLKKYVLLKAGITEPTPSDSKRLSVIISKATHKNVSETTIKRVLGFAVVKHQFSAFTLTALCEYVGKRNWAVFCEEVKEYPEQFPIMNKWDELHQKSRAVTKLCLKTIRNRSGIPYEHVIDREFAERDFEQFYHNNYSFTSFVAQPGCGKSILLSKLVEKLFLSTNAKHANDIVWMVNPNILSSSGQFNFSIEKWLNEQLELGDSFINYFNSNPDKRKGNVVIVLDGFDEIVVKKNNLQNQLNQLADFLCLLDGCSWLKVVLSMRSITWISFYEKIRHSAYLKSQWFPGNHIVLENSSNIPPLTDIEIGNVLRNIYDIVPEYINPQLKSQFRFPFYLQIYNQLKDEGFNFNYKTNLPHYEIISTFIQQKINLSTHYTEKVLLLKKIIQITQKMKKGNLIYKEALLGDITIFRDAYEELLLDGILVEEKQFDMVMPKENVRFIHPDIFEYFLFIELIDSNQRNIDVELFNQIYDDFKESPLKINLLQWLIRHAIINYNMDPIVSLLSLKLPTEEKNIMMLFILETLDYHLANKKNSHHKVIDYEQHEAFLRELLKFDFLGPCYKDILRLLKRLTAQPDVRVIYATLLAYISVLEMDIRQLNLDLETLKNIDFDTQKWVFNPAEVFDVVINKLSNRKLGNEKLFAKIEDFKNHPDAYQLADHHLSAERTISYILAFVVNFFCGSADDNIKIYNSIKYLNPNILLRRNSLSIFLLNFCALTGIKLYPDMKWKKLMNLLNRTQEARKYDDPEHFHILYLLVNAEYEFVNGNYKQAQQFAEKCLEVCQFKDIGLLNSILYFSLNDIYEKLKMPEKSKEMLYKLHCLLDEKHIAANSFINYKPIMSIKAY